MRQKPRQSRPTSSSIYRRQYLQGRTRINYGPTNECRYPNWRLLILRGFKLAKSALWISTRRIVPTIKALARRIFRAQSESSSPLLKTSQRKSNTPKYRRTKSSVCPPPDLKRISGHWKASSNFSPELKDSNVRSASRSTTKTGRPHSSRICWKLLFSSANRSPIITRSVFN